MVGNGSVDMLGLFFSLYIYGSIIDKIIHCNYCQINDDSNFSIDDYVIDCDISIYAAHTINSSFM